MVRGVQKCIACLLESQGSSVRIPCFSPEPAGRGSPGGYSLAVVDHHRGALGCVSGVRPQTDMRDSAANTSRVRVQVSGYARLLPGGSDDCLVAVQNALPAPLQGRSPHVMFVAAYPDRQPPLACGRLKDHLTLSFGRAGYIGRGREAAPR